MDWALSTGGCYRGPTLGHQRSQTRTPQGHRRRTKRLVSRGRTELPVLPRGGTTLRQCPRHGVLCHAFGQYVQTDGHGRQSQALRHNRLKLVRITPPTRIAHKGYSGVFMARDFRLAYHSDSVRNSNCSLPIRNHLGASHLDRRPFSTGFNLLTK